MSEEILKALMQLFAIISKQDDGSTANQREFVRSFLASQLNTQKVQEYLKLYDEKSGSAESDSPEAGQNTGKLTSMKDSVRTLSICRKINKTLTHKQKVIVLIRLFEMLLSEHLFTEQRMGIISTIATVFNLQNEEMELISRFIRNDDPDAIDSGEVLVISNHFSDEGNSSRRTKQFTSPGLDKSISILRIKSADLYFVKYNGNSEIFLNGLSFHTKKIYLFPQGSTLRVPKGTIYYNDVVSRFLSSESSNRLSFRADNIVYRFPNKAVGLRNINISEEFGLIGIMGASGSGKTTLLNVLSGIESPSEGTVTLNGLNIHKDADEAKSMIGYIAQDDFLMEDLTVFENLFYNSKLCFKNLSDEEIISRVDKTLLNLGLLEIKDIKVGNPMNKKISGGQRKRLNIALELIREPSVLFVDEPTSGLSSRDSENVMDLLKELSLQMKLIFVVIHQPSSDIFKMFDKLYILDTGGFPIYYGNPIEAVMYFKQVTRQINAEVGECHACGNVNPELLFSIIESKEVDDFGIFTRQRIKNPAEWNELFLQNFKIREIPEVTTIPQRSFQIPDKLKQLGIFIKRDVLSKISNLQYMLISLLEAPVMAVFLTVIIKYLPDNKSIYIFRENENIPPYIFMSIVIALFVGLSVSAEEIFRDRKILKRERFLNLSRSSYLLSKIIILFSLSAIQMLIFVLVGNTILGIKGLTFEYWSVLFASACFANVLGLNISSAFNSAVTIYILIPLLIIPQMALGGAMFNFDKINKIFGGGKGNTPIIADVMASRWAYEALAVTQFKNNRYEQNFYDIEQIGSQSNYKQTFYLPELEKILNESAEALKSEDINKKKVLSQNLLLLKNEFNSERELFNDLPKINTGSFSIENFNSSFVKEAQDFLKALEDKNITIFNLVHKKKNNLISSLEKEMTGKESYIGFYDNYYNDFLSDIVKKATEKTKIIRDNDRLVQNYEPIFHYPVNGHNFSLRAHFFSPAKYIFGIQVETILFNLIIIWLMSVVFYITLYYDILKKIIELSGRKGTVKKNNLKMEQ
jgi:ABC transport system ATP-binding/permease protein